jgi:tryptophanyl-tRNA synthetase
MSRMTQFKDKSAKLADDRISVGLFNYPVLMAADILLYGASYVPVGDDQSQHLEFVRDIAMRLNMRFGDKYPDGLFTVPKPVKEQHEFFGKDQGLRIKDLQDPTKKMSKSDENGKGVIFLGDDPVVAAKKIRSATTDSFGKIEAANKEQAGIKNLLQLIALVTGNDLQEVTDSYEGQKQYGPLKDDAAIGIGNFLGEFQERFAAVDEAQLMAKLQADEAQMNQIANTTLLKVQKAVGLRA